MNEFGNVSVQEMESIEGGTVNMGGLKPPPNPVQVFLETLRKVLRGQ